MGKKPIEVKSNIINKIDENIKRIKDRQIEDIAALTQMREGELGKAILYFKEIQSIAEEIIEENNSRMSDHGERMGIKALLKKIREFAETKI